MARDERLFSPLCAAFSYLPLWCAWRPLSSLYGRPWSVCRPLQRYLFSYRYIRIIDGSCSAHPAIGSCRLCQFNFFHSFRCFITVLVDVPFVERYSCPPRDKKLYKFGKVKYSIDTHGKIQHPWSWNKHRSWFQKLVFEWLFETLYKLPVPT